MLTVLTIFTPLSANSANPLAAPEPHISEKSHAFGIPPAWLFSCRPVSADVSYRLISTELSRAPLSLYA